MTTHHIDKKKKKQLIYHVPSLGAGGTERVVLNLCRNVSRDRFDIHVCAMVDGLFADEIRSLGIPVTILSESVRRNNTIVGKLRNYFRMLWSLRSLIAEDGPTVVHSHHFGPLMQLFFIRKISSKQFGWVHSEHSWTDVRNAYAISLYRFLNPLKSADIISGVAEKVTTYMRETSGSPVERAMTVLNGIETDQFCMTDGGMKRGELGFAPDDLIIGTVGMLRTEKNQQLLIRAFAQAVTKMSNLHLVICGDGVCRMDLEELAVSLGVSSRIHFLGYRMDTNEIMSVFDVYCLPSEYEGLPLSILEAWAAGKPVVATDVLGNIDIVRDEVNGLLVPLNDEIKMAEAILRLVKDQALANTIAGNGYEAVMADYDIRRMVDRYEQIYEAIAK